MEDPPFITSQVSTVMTEGLGGYIIRPKMTPLRFATRSDDHLGHDSQMAAILDFWIFPKLQESAEK